MSTSPSSGASRIDSDTAQPNGYLVRSIAAPTVSLSERLRVQTTRFVTDPMARSSLAIMSTTLITSLLGYIFWLVVARRFGAEVSGAASAATSALQATVLVVSVGAAAALVEWLPRSTSALEWRERLTAGLLVAVAGAVLGAPLVALVLGHTLDILPLLRQPAGAVLFFAGAVFLSVGTVVDYVAISERRSVTLVARSVVLTGLRIPLLFTPDVLVKSEAGLVLGTWTVAAAISLVLSAFTFATSDTGRTLVPAVRGSFGRLREMRGSFVGQHLITVAAMLAGYLLPLLVVARLGATENGYFYVTWMLGSIFSMISPAVSTALFAEGATTPRELHGLVRRCALLTAALLVVPILIYLIGGGFLLRLFGTDYATQGRLLLVLLTVSALPDAVTNIAVAVLRATSRLGEATLLNTAMLLGCLAGSWLLLPSLGIVAVGASWLGAQSLGVVWIALNRQRIFGRRPAG